MVGKIDGEVTNEFGLVADIGHPEKGVFEMASKTKDAGMNMLCANVYDVRNGGNFDYRFAEKFKNACDKNSMPAIAQLHSVEDIEKGNEFLNILCVDSGMDDAIDEICGSGYPVLIKKGKDFSSWIRNAQKLRGSYPKDCKGNVVLYDKVVLTPVQFGREMSMEDASRAKEKGFCVYLDLSGFGNVESAAHFGNEFYWEAYSGLVSSVYNGEGSMVNGSGFHVDDLKNFVNRIGYI